MVRPRRHHAGTLLPPLSAVFPAFGLRRHCDGILLEDGFWTLLTCSFLKLPRYHGDIVQMKMLREG